MFGDNVYTKIQEHNSSMRMLTTKKYSDLSEILSRSKSSLLVTGGSLNRRVKILCRSVVQTKSTSPYPCIILSNNQETEEALIELANAGKIGPLYVCSENYPEYDVFCGMTEATIAEIFANIAELTGYRDSSKIHNYSMAFLKVLKQTSDKQLSMSSIIEFSQNNKDIIIAQHAQSLGLSNEHDALSDPDGGKDFRNILEVIRNAFSKLTTFPCQTGFSLMNAVNSNATIYIRTSTPQPKVLGLYFSSLLNAIGDTKFHLILDDSHLLCASKFLEQIIEIKAKSSIVVNLFSKNACLYGNENLISHYSRHIILLDHEELESSDMQLIFNHCFKDFTAYDIGTGSSKPAHMFVSFEKSPQYNTVTYSRPKLLVEETLGYDAVIKGFNGPEFCLIKRLTI